MSKHVYVCVFCSAGIVRAVDVDAVIHAKPHWHNIPLYVKPLSASFALITLNITFTQEYLVRGKLVVI